jgi:hypothetical protein
MLLLPPSAAQPTYDTDDDSDDNDDDNVGRRRTGTLRRPSGNPTLCVATHDLGCVT